jgi:Protein of unknown function (DUF732)
MGRRRGRHRAKPSRTVRILRALTATAVIGGVTLVLSAFGPGYLERVWSSARADQRFVAAVQAQGRTVEPGANEALVLSAAHKLCERRDVSVSSAERRASTLTPEEIDAVRKTFGDDSAAFIKVATRTYCP